MYDLSWLNPTPHAIAVNASQPLSPVATQHSLPSGRYSLLGPDLHRLDRTSLCWRTYSITSSARSGKSSSRREAAFRLLDIGAVIGLPDGALSLQRIIGFVSNGGSLRSPFGSLKTFLHWPSSLEISPPANCSVSY